MDQEDYELVSQWRWKKHKKGYAYRNAGPAFEADPSIVEVGGRLPRQAMLAGWPSPTASLADKGVRSEGGAIREAARGHGPDLAAVASLAVDGWQTPTLEDSGRNGSLEGWQKFTDEQQWSQCRLRNQVHAASGPTVASSPAPTARRVASRLNASFSLWLMGYQRIYSTSSPGWSSAAWVERTLAEYYASLAETERAG